MDEQKSSNSLTKWSVGLLIVILGAGIFLRVWPSAGFKPGLGDEHVYAIYVEKGVTYDLSQYGKVIGEYISAQMQRDEALVPATRIGFLWPAIVLASVTKLEPLQALRWVSAIAAILLLMTTAAMGYRLGGVRQMMLVTTLMAVAPLQIFLAQRSLVDGYFAWLSILCAWFFFESIQAPQSRAWLLSYGLSLFVLVLTKENAIFVCVALMATWLCFLAARCARPNFALPLVTFVAGAAGVIVLASWLGGLSDWITFYRMYAQKSLSIPYVVKFQDGAWYRYLIDFTLISPGIVPLVFGVYLRSTRSRASIFSGRFFSGSVF